MTALTEAKRLEHLVAEELKLFVADKALEALAKHELVRRPRPKARSSALAARQLTFDQLIERSEFLAEYFLLCLKNTKMSGPHSGELIAGVMDRMVTTVIPNMLLLLARKSVLIPALLLSMSWTLIFPSCF